jgi:vesicle-fusing ATPase
MANDFLQQFNHQSFSVGQQVNTFLHFPNCLIRFGSIECAFKLAFQLSDQKKSLLVTVKEIEGADVRAALEGRPALHKKLKYGLLLPNSTIVYEKTEGSSINLVGKSKGKVKNQSIINPDWDFNKMGIGGLDKEFNTIFRRAFASRVFPPEVIQQLGMKHVRGILLFGPPGTGKTLMAR